MKSNQSSRPDATEQNHPNALKEGGARVASQSGDEFPGYPHYPAKEDIMHPSNNMEKISSDEENLTRSGAYLESKNNIRPVSSSMETAVGNEDDLVIVPGTEADVTKEDLLMLGEQDMERDEEEGIDNKVLSGDLDTEELDVPGEELDDANENIGEEDEENNYYSLGGDRHESLEEN